MGRPLISVGLGNQIILALVDTGASHTVIDNNIFSFFCENSKRSASLLPTVGLYGATGENIEVLGRTTIPIDKHHYSVIVVKNLKSDLIFGSNCIRQIDFVKQTVHLTGQQYDIHWDGNILPKHMPELPLTDIKFNVDNPQLLKLLSFHLLITLL